MVLRILNVNDTLDLKAGGGTAERTFQMSRFLAKNGAICEVLTLDSIYLDEQRILALRPAKVTVLSYIWRRFNVPSFSWGAIQNAVAGTDIIHLMGHWSLLNSLVYLAARRAGKPYVVCPAGALPIFGRSRWLKRIYNYVVGNAIIRNAAGWIAVTEGEFQDFAEYGIDATRVTVIPNGICADDFPVVDIAEFKLRYGLFDAPTLLFMGRLNLIKGPDLLLQAFMIVRRSFPKYHLVFVGPDGGMLDSLRETVARADLNDYVHFLGYLGGLDKSAAYRSADLLVVSSRQEAMSIVAIEAGICGTPALITDKCGLGEVCSIDTKLEVPASVEGLSKGILSLLDDAVALKQTGQSWLGFVKRKYLWDSLIPNYLELYKGILSKDVR